MSNPPGFHWLETMRWEVTGFTETVCDFHWRMGSDSICVRGCRGLVLCRHLIAYCLNSHHSFEKKKKIAQTKRYEILNFFIFFIPLIAITALPVLLFELIHYLGKYAMMDTWIFGNYRYPLLCTLLFHLFL